tara:strand:+ start:2691 stop:3419 length:729 start_codon:yes stop_codon:yes gene_type:complete
MILEKIKFYSKFGPKFHPVRANDAAAGWDLITPVDIFLPPGTKMKVDTGIVIDLSEAYPKNQLYTKLQLRSSGGDKKNLELHRDDGLGLTTTEGIIDQDYCGGQDTLKANIFARPDMDEYLGFIDFNTGEKTPGIGDILREDGEYYSRVYPPGRTHYFKKCFTCVSDWLRYEKGERFAQIIIQEHHSNNQVEYGNWYSIKDREGRGGIGSTGNGVEGSTRPDVNVQRPKNQFRKDSQGISNK